MADWNNENEAREEIRSLVAEYYRRYKKTDKPFTSGDRINYASRVFDEHEMCALTDATLDFWLTAGRFAEKFETEFSRMIGTRYVHLVNSGSSANLLAFMMLTAPELGERRIERGDEVITVAAGFPTTIAPIVQYGTVPVFVDITIPEYNIDVERLEAAVSEKTKAVMIAHTLGNPFDIKAVKEFCKRHKLWLIEDNCDALGSQYRTCENDPIGNDGYRFTGTFGDVGTSSFYPPHHITMGEGGCVYTDNPLLHKLILSYRDWGRDCMCSPGHDNMCGHRFDGEYGKLPIGYDHKYVYSHFGYNLKATDMQAAIGCEQLKKLLGFTEARKRNWEYIYNRLSKYEDIIYLPKATENSIPSWFGFMITLKPDSGLLRNDITEKLEKFNIQTRLLFAGNIIKQPCFDEFRGTDAYRVVGNLENTDYVMNNSFWIGVYPGMTEEKLDYMCDKIGEALEK